MELTKTEWQIYHLVCYFLDKQDFVPDKFEEIIKTVPTCTPNERAFLDEIREKGYIEYGTIEVLRIGDVSILVDNDFTKTNLSELVEVKG